MSLIGGKGGDGSIR